MKTTNPEDADYMVHVAIGVDAADPSEAVRAFVQHVVTHGLGSLTYTVQDLNDDDQMYIATTEEYATTEEVLKEAEREDFGTWWLEPSGWNGPVFGPYLDEVEASEGMDELGLSDTHYKIVERDLDAESESESESEPEPEPEPKPKSGKKKKAKPVTRQKGVCKRCGDLGELHPKTELCEECEKDTEGVPS